MAETQVIEKSINQGNNLEARVEHRNRFDRVPFCPRTELGGIPRAYLSGFESSSSLGSLRNRLTAYLIEKMSPEERQALNEESKKLNLFRKETSKKVMMGQRIANLRAPQSPITNKLESLIHNLESELTKKVVEQMSPLSKRFLEAEFQLLESHGHREMTIPQGKEINTANISSFFARLEAVAALAVEEREGSGRHLRRVS